MMRVSRLKAVECPATLIRKTSSVIHSFMNEKGERTVFIRLLLHRIYILIHTLQTHTYIYIYTYKFLIKDNFYKF